MVMEFAKRTLRSIGISRPGTLEQLRQQNQALRADRRRLTRELEEERGRRLSGVAYVPPPLASSAGVEPERPAKGIKPDSPTFDDFRTLRARARQIEQSAVHAREAIMVIEVKLDIIEGAITILDERSRRALAQPMAAVNGAPDHVPASSNVLNNNAVGSGQQA